eukprot:4719550-Pyramimonas_sp.AAC.1
MARVYGRDHNLAFLLYDIHLANSTMAAIAVSQQKGIDVAAVTASRSHSSGFWANEQDVLAD